MDSRTGLPVVGMVGAGQLARMTHQAAIALGQSLRVLADSANDGAALVAGDVVVGDYHDYDALRGFAVGCDVVTFDHEHVPGELIRRLAADGVTVLPSADALQFAQDKAAMRRRLSGTGSAVPALARPVRGRTIRAQRWPNSAPRLAGRSWSRPSPAVTTARGCGCSTTPPRPSRCWPRAPRCWPRRRSPSTTRRRRCGRPVQLWPGCCVADRGDRAAGRHLHRGDRPRAAA